MSLPGTSTHLVSYWKSAFLHEIHSLQTLLKDVQFCFTFDSLQAAPPQSTQSAGSRCYRSLTALPNP